MLYPDTFDEFPFHAKLTEWNPGCTPVPDMEIVVGEFAALLVSTTLPAAAPVAAGANVTVTVVLFPGARICPLALLVWKPAPAIVVFKIVRLVPPEFVSHRTALLLFPVSTFPKLSEEEEDVNWPGALTARIAPLLVALPTELPTITANASPLSSNVVGGVV